MLLLGKTSVEHGVSLRREIPTAFGVPETIKDRLTSVPLGVQRQRQAWTVAAGCDVRGERWHSSQGSKGKSLRRVIVDPAEKTRLIRACHDGIDGGHFGRNKTLSKVM